MSSKLCIWSVAELWPAIGDSPSGGVLLGWRTGWVDAECCTAYTVSSHLSHGGVGGGGGGVRIQG